MRLNVVVVELVGPIDCLRLTFLYSRFNAQRSGCRQAGGGLSAGLLRSCPWVCASSPRALAVSCWGGDSPALRFISGVSRHICRHAAGTGLLALQRSPGKLGLLLCR